MSRSELTATTARSADSKGNLMKSSQQAYSVSCKLMDDEALNTKSLQAHGLLTASSLCELILWVHCELDKWLQNELALSFHVSSLCIGFELKFFTGLACIKFPLKMKILSDLYAFLLKCAFQYFQTL